MAESPLLHHEPMELFPDGGFVRLESRVTGMFVHADEDWQRVSLRPSGGAVPSLNSVWRVEHWFSEELDATCVLLQNAAYGRYLSFSLQVDRIATQVDRNGANIMTAAYPWPCVWRVQRLAPPDQDYVRLRYFNCHLRANGGLFDCNTGVTVELAPALPRISDMLQWKVHAVGASPVPQHLPVSLANPGGCLSGLLFWLRSPDVGLCRGRRWIRHVRATDEGEFDPNHHNWDSFPLYSDDSLFELQYRLGLQQEDWNEDLSAFTLCMRPGSHGRLMPLLTDPPLCFDYMNIVVFKTGTPGHPAVVYPAGPAPLRSTGRNAEIHLFGNQKHLSIAAPDTVT